MTFFSFILVHTFVRSYFLCLFDLSVTSASWLASKFFYPLIWIRFPFYRVFMKYCGFFQEFSIFCSKIFNILRLLPPQHRAAIGCTENDTPIRVTVHSDLRWDELLSYMQGIWVVVNWENTQFLMNTLYFVRSSIFKSIPIKMLRSFLRESAGNRMAN